MGGGIGQQCEADVVVPEGFDERLGPGRVAPLRWADGHEAAAEAELPGEVACPGGDVARSVVREVRDGMWDAVGAEALADRGEHLVADVRASNARAGDGDLAAAGPALPVARGRLQRQAVQVENAQHPLAVGRLQPSHTALAVQERREVAVAVGGPPVDKRGKWRTSTRPWNDLTRHRS